MHIYYSRVGVVLFNYHPGNNWAVITVHKNMVTSSSLSFVQICLLFFRLRSKSHIEAVNDIKLLGLEDSES